MTALPVPGSVIARVRRYAFSHPWTGDAPINDRRHVLDTTAITEPGRPCRVLCTFDVGHHASCWWKNAQYEQCLHVSVSHPSAVRSELGSPSDAEQRAWGRAFFQADAPKAWVEPPASTLDPYRLPNVAHLRLFYNSDMEPFIPQGEVYHLVPWGDDDPILDRAGGDVR